MTPRRLRMRLAAILVGATAATGCQAAPTDVLGGGGPGPGASVSSSGVQEHEAAPETGAAPDPSALAPGSRPNILLISTDDQVDDDLAWMPRTRRLVQQKGLDFTDGISPHPLCCPARAGILTGEYAHNNGVRHNDGKYGGYQSFMAHNATDHLGVWLQRAGYRTAFLGKAMNGYEADGRRMPGWDFWDATSDGSYAYYGTKFDNNGDPVADPDAYVTDVVRDHTVALIERYAKKERPFFVWASHVAPHDASDRYGSWGPPVPAERHRDLFGSVALPSADEPSFRGRGSLAARTLWFRDRLRSLQGVDEANAAMIRALRRAGVLDETLVVFVSDNGFQLGQHGLYGKNLPFEESLQVPFLVRGPGIQPGTTSRQTATIVDLAPTFLDAAGALDDVRRRGRVDGASLLPAFTSGFPLADSSLIQGGTDDPRALREWGWQFRGVRTARYTWVREWTGRELLFDRRRDPYQRWNLVRPSGRLADRDYADVRRALVRRYRALRDCAGTDECQRSFGAIPPP